MPQLISRLYNFVNDKNNGIAITSSRVDAEFNQLVATQNQALIVAASAPSSPFEGMFWYDSTNKLLKEYRNAEWIIMGVVHVSSTVMATIQAGDVWVDTSGSEIVYKVRNKANSAWLILAQSTSTSFVPTNGIITWSGLLSAIPSGYVICDGSNGTVDLRQKMIVCTAAGADPGAVSGTGYIPSHSHNIPNHQHSLATNITTGSRLSLETVNVGGQPVSHNEATFSDGGGGATTSTGSATLYALAFIMKT